MDEHARDEMICDRCGEWHGVVWFAPSDVWNATMRDGDRANQDMYGFCCPHCFMRLSDLMHGARSWLVTPFDDGPVNRAEQITFARDPAPAKEAP